jgi:hypothetical protein
MTPEIPNPRNCGILNSQKEYEMKKEYGEVEENELKKYSIYVDGPTNVADC